MKYRKIYKYNKKTGLWDAQKTLDSDQNLEEWLKIYTSDEPEEYFTYGYNRPNGKPDKPRKDGLGWRIKPYLNNKRR